jgi:N-acetyl-anhydromuramyl-L-alanine amidase AmpD
MTILQKPAHPNNYSVGRTAKAITHVVIHVEAGWEAGTATWFANPASHVSAHYSVGKDGAFYQHVAEANTAWHAGLPYPFTWNDQTRDPHNNMNPNVYTIGIEHEGFAAQAWPDAQVQASAALVADVCKRHGIPIDRNHVVGHHEIYAGHDCPSAGCPIDKIVQLAAAVK